MAFVQFICAFIVLWFLISMAWPDTRKQQAEAARKQQADADNKHRELLATIAKLEHQTAAPPTPSVPNRAHVLALGRERDLAAGVKRHPVLDSPYVSVAQAPKATDRTPRVI